MVEINNIIILTYDSELKRFKSKAEKNDQKPSSRMNEIKFCGAAREVTGSMFYLRLGPIQLLLDAGAFQGNGPNIDSKNASPFPFNPEEIDYIFISHGHLDHIGKLPLLYKRGFRGIIVSTLATKEITMRNLSDSLKFQKGIKTKEESFSSQDLKGVEHLFFTMEPGATFECNESDLRVKFIDAEHILGSVSIHIEKPFSILYTGDLGGGFSVLHSKAIPRVECDCLIMESTYGNRNQNHGPFDSIIKVKEAIFETIQKGGRLLIPVFAIGRAEELLVILRNICPGIPIYFDSPMGKNVLEIYKRHIPHFNGNLSFFETVKNNKESKRIATSSDPCVIISCSGMLQGGPIMNYLPELLSDKNNMVLFTGYQGKNMLGARLLNKTKRIRIDGKRIEVRAKIDRVQGLSAHVDRKGLIEYLSKFTRLPKKIFLVHGEEKACKSLKKTIQEFFNLEANCPKMDEYFDLEEIRPMHIATGKDIADLPQKTKSAALKYS